MSISPNSYRLSRNQIALAAIMALITATSAAAQHRWLPCWKKQCDKCVPPHCELLPPESLPKKDSMATTPSPSPMTTPLDPGFDPGTSVAGLGQTSAVPNIFGSQFGSGTGLLLVGSGSTATNGGMMANGGVTPSPLFINVANPAGGGNVGRLQIAEDNNPWPLDRLIFMYDYFDTAALTPRGFDVHRFIVGFEKTFFDGMASVEVRLPFASTLNSEHGFMNGDRNAELGNLQILLKALLLGGEKGAVAAGMGISVPTADDARVSTGGTEVVRIENEAVILSPYIAAAWTPTQRLFSQIWLSWDFDANGNPVFVNPNVTPGGLLPAGTITDQTLMLISGQVGAWIYQSQDRSALLRALAPFIELHYVAGLGDPDRIQSGNFSVGKTGGDFDELNLTCGIVADLGPRGQFMVGVVSPLRTGEDRTFDYQIGARLNIFFGPTVDWRRNMFTPFTF